MAVTSESGPVILLLGADGPSPWDPAEVRTLGEGLVAAAAVAGAALVDGLGGSVGEVIVDARADSPLVSVSTAEDPIGHAADLAGPHRVVVVLVGGDARVAELLLDRRARAWSIVA